jgi:hypothetical protein
MTEEEIKAREAQARREYPQTKAAFDRVRAAATENIFKTKPTEQEKREEIYRLVQILDEVERELLTAVGQGSEAIDEYIKSIGTTGNR